MKISEVRTFVPDIFNTFIKTEFEKDTDGTINIKEFRASWRNFKGNIGFLSKGTWRKVYWEKELLDYLVTIDNRTTNKCIYGFRLKE